MSQDTRKDPRAKIVSLNVRYKSATVDEFIENHSHDVSRGGLFIKTSTPFAQGTLLKFEIRLSSDQPVIAGVGRVVWKREPSQAASDRPAGMGVKFIKIDDRSRSTIEKLVTTKQDAGGLFTKHDEEVTEVRPPSAPPRVPLSSIKPTVSGMPAVKPDAEAAAPAVPSAAPTPTFTGEVLPAATAASSSSSGGFFPKTNSEADMPPPQERTMMRQAAELLEEALKASGGSMAEVEQNPLFAGGVASAAVPAPTTTQPLAAQPMPVAAAEPEPARAPNSYSGTIVGMPSPSLEPSTAREEVATIGGFPTSSPNAAPAVVTPAAAALAAAEASEAAPRRSTPPAARGSVPPARTPSEPPRSTSQRPVRATDMLADSVPKKSGGGLLWAGLAVVAIGGGLAYAYQAGMLNEIANQPSPPSTATVTQTAPAVSTTASAPPSAAHSATPPPAESASAAATPSATASTAPSASAVASAPTKTPVEPPVAAKTPAPTPPKPKPVAKPVEAKTEEKPAETTPAEKPAETKPAETKPAETKPAETTEGDTPKPAPKKPAPKKPKEDSDNPY